LAWQTATASASAASAGGRESSFKIAFTIKHLEASISKIPSNTVKLEAGKAESMLKLMEKLEDNDDVQNVYSNFDIDEDVMEKLS